MYLKALEMQGFKSFPDKISLKFGKGVTAVVGPNGSGKSNIADAVRWVLGEQSTKSLRGTKMEDVIFSGTRDRKAQGFAEVTLTLDNSDSLLNSTEKEVAVTRRYYRSGESVYLINSKACRLKDVNELFMDTGLGRDGYAMVGQGRIEEMISAKSENRRDMLEEAAGISAFRYRRVDALKKLERAEENLVRLRDIVSELHSRVGPLEKQSEKAQKFLVYSAERKKLEISLWVDALEHSEQLLREQTNRICAVEAQYKAAGEALEKFSASIDRAAEGTRNINLRLEQIRLNREKLEQRAAALENQAAVFENTIENNLLAVGRLKKEIENRTDANTDIDREVSAIKAAVSELEASISEENKTLEKLSDRLAGLKKTDEEYSQEYNNVNLSLSKTAIRLSSAEIAISAAQSSAGEIAARIKDLESSRSEKIQAAERTAREKTEKEADFQRICGECEALVNIKTGYELKVRQAEKKTEQCRADSEAKKLLLLSKQSRLKFLQDTEKSMEGYQGSVKAVLRESSRGTLTGIRGILVNLIEVEEQYQTAVETALGNAVQDIVTETDSDAEKAIYMLRNTGAGRATFLPLSAIKGRVLEEKGIEKNAGFAGLAYRLAVCSPEYDEIMKFLLGRIAVCESLKDGLAMAKKYSYRFKIVTLDGQVINAGGSMTGGSKISHSGFLARRTEIEKLEKECEKLAAEAADSLTALKDAAENAVRARMNTESCAAELFGKSEEKMRAGSVLELLKSRCAELETAVEAENKEEERLRERASILLKDAENAEKQRAGAAAEKETQEKELARLSGGRDSLLEQRQLINEEISAVNMKIIARVKECEAKKETISSLNRRKEELNVKKEDLDREIALLAGKNEAMEKDIADTRSAAAALKEKEGEEQDEARKLMSKRDELEKAVTDARMGEKDKNSEREKLNAEKARLEEKKAYLEKEQCDTEKKLFDEYALTRRQAAETAEKTESVPKANKRLSELKGLIKALGSVNVSAIDEYKEVRGRYDFLSSQVDDAEKSKKELLKLITSLTEKMSELFREKFDEINASFKETFTRLFSGGAAELILENENDILECNIEIKAQPPGKNVKSLSLLSGGEKGLTAVALLFAILKVRPSPFCIFDEVEAALDDVNVLRYAQYVRSMSDNSQFILITHRRGSMEEADMLYGVTMQERGVSKLLELDAARLAMELELE